MKTTVPFFAFLFALAVGNPATAQTFTTRAAGAWNNPATWVGGSMPSATIAAGQTVDVRHAVLFNLSSDLTIDGTLKVSGDTLRFGNSYDRNVKVETGGFLHVVNGGFLQHVPSNKSELHLSGGRLVLENARMAISKNVKASAGTRRAYRNSEMLVGEKYEMEGSRTNRTIDTVQNSLVEVGINNNDFDIKKHCTILVANANFVARNGKFSVDTDTEIKMLPGALGNYGIDFIKTKNDLENKGAWDARVDEYCVGGNVTGSMAAAIDFTKPQDCSATVTLGNAPAPQLAFSNPVLVEGQANRPGAVYRFTNITGGVDAEVKLKQFSRTDIVMESVDLASAGYDKAFQPQFGLPGWAPANQEWYVDFELVFYKAGTKIRKTMDRLAFTALDVDGDGGSLQEYAAFLHPSSVALSAVTTLTTTPAQLPDSLGVLQAGMQVNGPVQNFVNIDTNGTAAMATFIYLGQDAVQFRYGARTGAGGSNQAGVRLNSLWMKSFSLNIPKAVQTLPVNFQSFSAWFEKGAAVVTWTAYHDELLSHYLVQRSTDGTNFHTIATVFPGNGISNYRYTDRNATGTTVYYRVIGVDYTAETSATAVRRVSMGDATATLALQAYPNPASATLNLSMPAQWTAKAVDLRLVNASGVTVQTQRVRSAQTVETLQVAALPKGIYLVQAVCEGRTSEARVVKQ